MVRSVASISLGLVLATVGCSSSPNPATPDSAEPAPPAKNAEVGDAGMSNGQLSRSYVDSVLKQGPSWLLQRVSVEEVIDKGKFVGWRLLDLPPGWNSVGIDTGDVITQVNGIAIERPGDLWTAWSSAAAADAIVIEYLRGAEAHSLRMPITGAPNGETQAALNEQPTPGARPQSEPPRQTIVISGADAQ